MRYIHRNADSLENQEEETFELGNYIRSYPRLQETLFVPHSARNQVTHALQTS